MDTLSTLFSQDQLIAMVRMLAGRRALVLGDIFLDEYIEGRATRLSREAPVPVLEYVRRWVRPGGGANPAHNIVALGSYALQVGVVGDDEAGRQLREALRDAGIDAEGVIIDTERVTTTKTRIVSHGSLRFPQQVARVDRLDRRPLDRSVEQGIADRLDTFAPRVEAVLISDYRTSVLTERVIAAALRTARRHGIWITVDSQGGLERYQGVDLLKCNQLEAEQALGYGIATLEDVRTACEELRDRLGCRALVITRGPQGMAGVNAENDFVSLPAANQTEVYDVVGAGDTVIAVLTLALAAGLPFSAGLQLANLAAGLVVRRLGNATASPAELIWAIRHWMVSEQW